MKRIIKLMGVSIAAFLTILLFPSDFSAYCQDDEIVETSPYTEQIKNQVDEILDDYDISYSLDDISDMSLDGLASGIKESVESRIAAPFRLLGIILILVIFSAFIKSAGESALSPRGVNMFSLVSVISAVTVISTPLLNSFDYAADAMERGGNFMLVFVPVFAGISVFSGGLTAVSTYNVITLSAAEIFVELAKNIFMPVIGMTAALAVVNSVFSKAPVDGLIRMIQKAVTWSLTVLTTLFTGFLTIKSTISAAADGAAAKTVRLMISGFVPVVGGAVSDAYSTVKGSLNLVRCTAGAAGVIAISMILLPPVLELLCFRLVMKLGAGVAGLFSAEPIEKLLKSLDAGLSIAIAIIVCFSLLFIISTAILMKTISGV